MREHNYRARQPFEPLIAGIIILSTPHLQIGLILLLPIKTIKLALSTLVEIEKANGGLSWLRKSIKVFKRAFLSRPQLLLIDAISASEGASETLDIARVILGHMVVIAF